MTSENIKKFKTVTYQLEDVLQNLQEYHLGNDDFSEPIGKMKTDFAIWYFEKLKNPENFDSISEFNSFQFLEGFYGKFHDYYKSYFKIKSSPLKKSLFFNSETKRQSILEKKLKKVETTASKLFTAVDLFVENAEKTAKINQKDTVDETESEDELINATQTVEEISNNETIELENTEKNIQQEIADENIISDTIEIENELTATNQEIGETIDKDEHTELENTENKKVEVSNFEEISQESESEFTEETLTEDLVPKDEKKEITAENIEISSADTQETSYETTEPTSNFTDEVIELDLATDEPVRVENDENVDESIVQKEEPINEEIEEVNEEDIEDEDEEDDNQMDDIEKLKQMLRDDFENKLKSL